MMKAESKAAADVAAYISALPESARPVAEAFRRIIRATLPQAIETISYGIPAYKVGRRTVIYFAIWKAHAAFYPIHRGSSAFEARVAAYRDKKDTVRFELKHPMPMDVIQLIVREQAARIQA
jgi:uncharacterized protein YdhG (YjbR/CyaY superfamily)